MTGEPVAVVGAGSIGVGWAVVFARAGMAVRLHDPDGRRLRQSRADLDDRLAGLAAADLLDESPDLVAGRVLSCERLADALAGSGHVQECAPEDVALKRALFTELDVGAPPEATIASSSSAIAASVIADDLVGRERCLVVHPGNPPYLLPVAEVVPAPFTAERAVRRVEELLRAAGMSPVRVRSEVEGFVFNRLQGAVLREAYCLVRDGVVSAADLDRVVREGLGRRWSVVGPFATAELNTRGGIEAHAARLGPAYARMGAERGQHDPWTPELVTLVAAAVHRQLPPERWEEHVQLRDRALMVLERARRGDDFRVPGAAPDVDVSVASRVASVSRKAIRSTNISAHSDQSLECCMDTYLEFAFAADPILASSVGVRDHDGELGDVSPDAVADQCATRRRLLAEIEAEPVPPVGSMRWLDHETALVELRTAVRRDEDARVWARAPYWYAERLGAAISVLMSAQGGGDVEHRAEMLTSRLGQIPRYLRDAQANLTEETPAMWAQMGVSGGKGLVSFLSEAVPAYAAALPDALGAVVSTAARGAVPAAQQFTTHVADLEQRTHGSWASGKKHFDYLLTNFHRLDLDSDALHELGAAKVAQDRARLEELAARVDPTKPWPEQIARIKDRHPQPEEFLSTYGDEMVRSREHTLAHDLAWVPDGENCRMDWVPSYRAASLPIAVMSTTPPFAPGLQSEWLITPSDPSAPEERRLEQMRDNCYVFAESIAGHEIYPGHHLQKVHHKLGTQDSPIRRLFSSPLFVEGWGLYVEDLFEETGFMDNDAVMLFKLRNALWRSLRIVIDTGLHTRGLSFEDAVSLLVEHAGMDTHMAAGEVRRYTRHDNPTYPSSYVLGKDAIHDLRERWRQQVGTAFTYRDFHDRLLSYGSIPVSLVAAAMTRPAAT